MGVGVSHANSPAWNLDPEPVDKPRKKRRKRSNRLRRIRLKKLGEHPRCHYCRRPVSENDSSLDHVIPRSKGGSSDEANLVLACVECNNAKGGKDVDEFLSTRGIV